MDLYPESIQRTALQSTARAELSLFNVICHPGFSKCIHCQSCQATWHYQMVPTCFLLPPTGRGSYYLRPYGCLTPPLRATYCLPTGPGSYYLCPGGCLTPPLRATYCPPTGPGSYYLCPGGCLTPPIRATYCPPTGPGSYYLCPGGSYIAHLSVSHSC